jgi:heat shock protein beta
MLHALVARDLDGDGIPNRLDIDVDGDGILNQFDRNVDGGFCRTGEFKGKYVGDRLPNGYPRERDIDDDGLLDTSLAEKDIDGDGLADDSFLELDIDGDGIPNYLDRDMDGDGVDNVPDDDQDGDGSLDPRLP